MKLVVGLGNPGERYANTRHNVGFVALDEWAAQKGQRFSKAKNFDYLVTGKAILIKPTTYMNLSGEAIREVRNRWDIEDVLVIYDDLELPLASLRIRTGGGDGGHNGLKSLAQFLPLNDLKRFRIGIGRDPEKDPAQYVLEKLTDDEVRDLGPVFKLVGQYIDLYLRYDFSRVLNEYSKWKKSCSDSKKQSGTISPKEEE